MVVLLDKLSDAAGKVSVMDSTGSSTSMLSANASVVPATDVTVTVYSAAVVASVGVPYSVPLDAPSDKPAGRDGLTL